MKILAVSNLYPPHYIGGYELRCQQTIEAMIARGHEVNVLTSNHGLSGEDALRVEPGVERSLWLNGCHGHPSLGIRRLRELEFYNNNVLRAAIAAHRPDVVHVWNLGGISKSLTLTLQALNIPTVYDVSDQWIARSLAGDLWLRWWNRKDAPLSQRLMRAAATSSGVRKRWSRRAPTNPLRHIQFSRIYFSSRMLREITRQNGYAVEHGGVIHCPVNTRRFSGEPRSAHHPMRKLLYVGRLTADEGALTALKAMALIRNSFPGELNLYGRGEPHYESMLKAFAEAEGLRVNFRTATAEQLPAIYREHDALLFTSEREDSFALTPLEAMSSGLPVIGTTTGGSIEIFRHGENSLTYPAGDEWELAQRIVEFEADSRLRQRMAALGCEEVREQFNEPRIMDQIEHYLLESIAQWCPSVLPEFSA